ncbi:hypothetical protein BDZ89DRAFT_587564 [Hymenopellis radicata]|nr:hypothetical protein BDZ89DRAFT_587564 [Hymenopellis radicata]
MQRFRKRSGAKKPFVPYSPTFHTQPIPAQAPIVSDVLPQLPVNSDFRTSLILPDLSRRFSVLRSSSGEPVSVDALRLKFAQQRARGAENQVSEEEEDMLFESLGFRARAATPSKSQENVSDGGAGASTSSIHSYTPSSPASRSTKRYSNNLFGSGKFRDYTYVRNASSKASSRVHSSTSTDTSPHTLSFDTNNTDPFAIHSAPLTVPAPFGDPQPSVGIPKALGKAAYKRASLALEQAINEIEEEDEEGPEDEVVLPRSAPIMRDHHRLSPDPIRSMNPRSFEASGMAISSDKHIRSDSDDRRASPVPSKTLPGYIPGMPRPMTPREMDSGDEQRSYSTTPRATSPTMLPNRIDSSSPSFSASVMSNFMRSDTASAPASVRQSPVPMAPYATTPLFLQRSPNGRQTPDEPRSMSSEIAIDFDQSLNASILGRRRAASPLSSAGHSGSRPGTPSSAAMVWPQPPSSPIRHTHNRNGSWFSDGGSAEVADQSNANNGKGPGLRSLKSPALPDSPLINRGHSTVDSISSLYSQPDKRPTSPMSTMELGSSTVVGSRIVRSPTPSHDAPRSPTSPTFSNGGSPRSVRSSKQNVASTQFNFDSLQPLVFSPLANSSRSSLESAGSSYHSWQGDRKEGLNSLFNDSDAQQSAWCDVYVSDQSSSITPGASSLDDDAEAILQAVGLHKSDFLTIQEKLVQVASIKSTPSDTPNRAPSLRRRRPSTSQSTYSHNGRVTSSSPLPHSPQNSGFMPTVDTSKKDVVESSDDSSPTRKNKAIAHLLFGQEEADASPPHQVDPSPYDNDITFTSFSFPKDPIISPLTPMTPPLSATSASGPYSLPRKSIHAQVTSNPAGRGRIDA